MILVTLGTQDKSFKRLLELIDEEINNGNIKEEVVAQVGYTNFSSNNMKMFNFIDREEFSRLVNECDLLITHGGVGAILNGIKNNKKVIACPRLSKYGEHINDHQTQIVDNFSRKGYIMSLNENDELSIIIRKSATFKPKKFVSNTEKIVKIIKSYIDNN